MTFEKTVGPATRRAVTTQGPGVHYPCSLAGLALAAGFLASCSDAPNPEPLDASSSHQVEQNVVYGMYGGTALLMDVHRPSNPNGRGLIWINGGRWAAADRFGGPPRKDAAIPQVFLDAGFTVFPINHRGVPTFTYPAAVEDALRAVRFIRHNATRFGIDPDRIGAVGFSSGGHLASLVGVMDGDGDAQHRDPVERVSAKVQALAVAAAPVDFLDPEAHRSAAYPALLAFMGGGPGEMPDRYREASPITHVSPDDPPLLIVHGDADRTVLFSQSERMKAALEAEGIPAELVRIPGGEHGASDYSAMVRWLARHLVGKPFAADLEPVITAHDRLEEGAMAAYAGDIDTALAAYAEAERVLLVHIPGGHLNALCWNGGRFERAADVIEACDRAVALDPENRFRHDSRGLVRAQLGDLDGAAEDFDFFIETGSAQDARRIQQRRGWLEELRAGRNPFTPEVLQELRGG